MSLFCREYDDQELLNAVSFYFCGTYSNDKTVPFCSSANRLTTILPLGMMQNCFQCYERLMQRILDGVSVIPTETQLEQFCHHKTNSIIFGFDLPQKASIKRIWIEIYCQNDNEQLRMRVFIDVNNAREMVLWHPLDRSHINEIHNNFTMSCAA